MRGLTPSAWLDLRPITERLAAGTLDPAAVSGGGLLTILAILLVLSALVITGASGFQERAENAARQGAQAQEALRTRSGQEMWATMFRSGVPSPLRTARYPEPASASAWPRSV
ncbi:MAG: hypothetical protein M3Z66_02915 [Chloroflexota bacterium]|nr:hypothetical protein [Chloroflexota bacterium]